jgi:GNAT superfamily N-acetyltransferase
MHPVPIIRSVVQSDAPALARFMVALDYFSALVGVSPDAAEARVGRNIATALASNSHSIYLALLEDIIVGYVAVHWLPCLYMESGEGFISELFVGDAARGQGVGALLLETVIADARQRGCTRLELTNIKERDSYKRGFYAKQGWEERPQAANFVYRL